MTEESAPREADAIEFGVAVQGMHCASCVRSVEEALVDLGKAGEAGADAGEIGYLRAQTLMEMGRSDDARRELLELERSGCANDDCSELLEQITS